VKVLAGIAKHRFQIPLYPGEFPLLMSARKQSSLDPTMSMEYLPTKLYRQIAIDINE